MIEAIVLVCFINTECVEIHDDRGPYLEEIQCKARVAEMLEDFSKVGETTKPADTTIVKNVSKEQQELLADALNAGRGELNSLIEKFTPDWENERIANLDLIIIKMCICEFMYFPSIPVRVSMNEYVEISKDYSSPESGKFINGVVNNILKDLTKKNLLEKN